MVDHDSGELGSVNEDDRALNGSRVCLCFLAEVRSGDEDSLAGPLALEGSSEALDLRPTDRGLPPLSLKIDRFETETVFLDDAIDPFVGAWTNRPSGIALGPAVAHGDKEIDH